jgi:SSS family solute:Na+ symporter
LQRLLHRGKYAVDAEGNPLPEPEKPPRTWKSLLGVDENFTRGDRIQSAALFWWSMLWFVIFLVVAAWNLIFRWPTDWWYWYTVYTAIFLPLVVSAVMIVWFTWGGVRDLRRLFTSLAIPCEAIDEAEPAETGVSPLETGIPIPQPITVDTPLAPAASNDPLTDL